MNLVFKFHCVLFFICSIFVDPANLKKHSSYSALFIAVKYSNAILSAMSFVAIIAMHYFNIS